MKCKEFVLAQEDYLALHPGTLPAVVPAALEAHVTVCGKCRAAWTAAAESRLLLASLQEPAPPTDAYFVTRLMAQLRERKEADTATGWRSLRVAGRDLALAGVLFAATLGSFMYNFRRTERPNIDEAMVLDVPHLNPNHPGDDHVRPRPVDAMLNLLRP